MLRFLLTKVRLRELIGDGTLRPAGAHKPQMPQVERPSSPIPKRSARDPQWNWRDIPTADEDFEHELERSFWEELPKVEGGGAD